MPTMRDRLTVEIRGVRVPGILYGTAWKEEATESLVAGALGAGFRGIDTANQRKHYDEAGTGRGIARALRSGIARDELFVQTKFTHLGGQDHRLPYDGLAPADREAWRAIEALAAAGRVALIGISNVTARQVRDLVELARVAPAFVQNRCYAERGWDRAVRALCAEHGIVYQAFSLLPANRDVLAHRGIRAIAARHGVSPAQVVFRFAREVGMLPLTGTRSPQHMREDLAIDRFELDPAEVAIIDSAGEG